MADADAAAAAPQPRQLFVIAETPMDPDCTIKLKFVTIKTKLAKYPIQTDVNCLITVKILRRYSVFDGQPHMTQKFHILHQYLFVVKSTNTISSSIMPDTPDGLGKYSSLGKYLKSA